MTSSPRSDPGRPARPDPAPKPDIVVEGGILLSMVEGQPPVGPARVCIGKDRIVDIRWNKDLLPRPVEEGAEFIDARDGIIMPGLINGHCHTAMTLFRGIADDLPLKQWLFEKIFPAEAAYLNPDTVYAGALLGCLEMIACGTTTLLDGYFFQDHTLKAVHDAGLRGLIAQGVIDFPAPGVPDPAENLMEGQRFLERWRDFSDLITPGLFCHSPLTCSEGTLRGAMEISRRYEAPLQIHLSETREEREEIMKRTGLRPVHYLDRAGLLGPHLIAAHGVHLDDAELDLLSERGVRLIHVPQSNMKLSSGVARVSEMLERDLTVGLGTDGCASNNDLDLFQEMDCAAKLQKAFSLDPESLAAEKALRMATAWGAKVPGLEREIGTIQVGKRADIIVVDLRNPHLIPLYNPISTLVYSANGSDVKDVIVNGRILMKDRRFQTLDPWEIMDRVNFIAMKVIA
ncbi:MAG: amidohydrolase [Deltaproteobacteria bacterium]|nr:amidohydrolase [Deltaproteobacteria bacterium]